jgi:hypothetical protein
MTIGAMIPDLEPLIGWMLGLSVFCGWDFPCSLEPDRLVLHSLFGAATVDAGLAILFVKLIGLAKIERLGVHGFSNSKIDLNLYASAAIGSASHVLIDWLHHPANPVFWPVPIYGSYYVGGLLLPFMSVFAASLALAIVSGGIIAVITRYALNKAGYSFWLAITNPPKTVSIVTEYLSKS